MKKKEGFEKDNKQGAGGDLFGHDDFIHKNKGLKNKWYIQNLNNLRKAKTQFREWYLHMELENFDEFRKQKQFLEQFFIGRKPEKNQLDEGKGEEDLERALNQEISQKDRLSTLELSEIKADSQREMFESIKKNDKTPFDKRKKLQNTQSMPNFNPKLIAAPKKDVK